MFSLPSFVVCGAMEPSDIGVILVILENRLKITKRSVFRLFEEGSGVVKSVAICDYFRLDGRVVCNSPLCLWLPDFIDWHM